MAISNRFIGVSDMVGIGDLSDGSSIESGSKSMLMKMVSFF